MRRRRRRRDPEEIRAILGRFRKSGLSQQAFARRIGVHVGVLGRWIRKERESPREGRPPSLVPVRVLGPVVDPVDSRGVEVLLERGHLVRVRPGFDEATLALVIGVLEKC